MHTCSKIYPDLPFAHRQHNHKGHCALIHGHNFDLEFTFAADRLDANMFVVDFGELKFLRAWLEDKFDHTLLLNEDDPYLPLLRQKLERPDVELGAVDVHNLPFIAFAKIVTVPNCGAEGLAQWLHTEVNKLLKDCGRPDWVERGVRVHRVLVREDSKNYATFEY